MQGRKVMLLLLLLGSLKTAQITFQEKLARFARLRLKVSKTSEGSEVEEKKKGRRSYVRCRQDTKCTNLKFYPPSHAHTYTRHLAVG